VSRAGRGNTQGVDLSAEAQKWFLAALACNPRNVNALLGVARTCQHLVSNPWWADPRAAGAASDLGREAVALALELEPGNASAKCIQGMLHSAAGRLEDAASAFRQALAIDGGLALAHGFGGYNAALLGRAGDTAPAVERAMNSITQIGGTASSSFSAASPSSCLAGHMRRSCCFKNR